MYCVGALYEYIPNTTYNFEFCTFSLNINLLDFSLLPLIRWDLRSCETLNSVQWLLLTDVSGQNIGPNFMSQ
jgi:hypothetical protein